MKVKDILDAFLGSTEVCIEDYFNGCVFFRGIIQKLTLPNEILERRIVSAMVERNVLRIGV